MALASRKSTGWSVSRSFFSTRQWDHAFALCNDVTTVLDVVPKDEAV